MFLDIKYKLNIFVFLKIFKVGLYLNQGITKNETLCR